MKPMAPGSLLIIFAFAIYFSLPLFSDLYFQNPKIPCCNFLLFILSRVPARSIYPNYYKIIYPFTRGIDNPSFTSGCEYLFFVCRCCLRCVAWFSYWFDNLGLITEGNTYRCYAASSLPLWGNTDIVLANIKRNFWRRC